MNTLTRSDMEELLGGGFGGVSRAASTSLQRSSQSRAPNPSARSRSFVRGRP